MAEQQLRAFIAVPLPETVKRALGELQRELHRSVGEEARWMRPETSHLTLRFLGDISEDFLEKIGAVMLSVKASNPSFLLRVHGVGAFPSPVRARVLWSGLDGAPPLLKLAADLETGLHTLGLPPEERPFAPHLTLARLRQARDLRAVVQRHLDFDGGIVPVERLVLYESRLLPGGAQHIPRVTVELGGSQ